MDCYLRTSELLNFQNLLPSEFLNLTPHMKSDLRRLIRQRKQALSRVERDLQSIEIMRLLEDHPVFQKAHVVLLYAALSDEVQTLPCIERWSATKQILLPVVVGDCLELRRYTHPTELRQGSFGILEPTDNLICTDYASIDLAVIPGVAFTPEGVRLGRGKGFYDRLLSHPAFERVHKMGICFPCQMMQKLPSQPHDVRMNEVLTLYSATSTLILEP